MSNFGKALLQLGAGSDENLDDGDVIPNAAQATGLSYSAPECETGSAPRSISRSTIRGSSTQAA
jgi:hypothetical protein